MADAPLDVAQIAGAVNLPNNAGLMKRLEAYEAGVSASQSDMNAALARAAGAAGASAGGASLEAKGQIAVNNETMRAAIQKKTDDSEAAARVGMTPSAPSELVMATVNNYNANQRDMLERASMIEDKKKQEFFDDPLQWLANQYSLPMDIASYNLKVGEQERNLAFLGGLSKTFDDQEKINRAVDVPTGEAMLAGMNNIALGKAAAAAAGSQMALARFNLELINMRTQQTENVFGNYMRASDFLGKERDRELALRSETRADQAAERAEAAQRQAMLESNARLAEGERKEAARGYLQNDLNRASDAAGVARIPVDQYLLAGSTEKYKWLSPFLMQAALQNADPTAPLHLGSTPVESVNITRGVPMPVTQEPTRKWIEGQVLTLIAQDKESWKQRGPDVQFALSNKAVEEAAKKERANIPIVASATTLYAPGPLRTVMNMASLLRDDKKGYKFGILDDLYVLQEANPTVPTDPNLFAQAALSRMRNGLATIDQVSVELSSIYKAIGMDQTALKAYDKFNLPSLMADNGGFRQTLQFPGLPGVYSGREAVVDLMNASAWRTFLEKLNVAVNVSDMRNPNTPQGRAAMGLR